MLATPLSLVGLLDWSWIGRNYPVVLERTVEHVILTATPMALGIAISLPLALVSVRWPQLYGPLLGTSNFLFTIPSLALFAMMATITGLSYWSAIVPLTIYTLLVLLRNMVEGLRAVDDDVLESATAMGLRRPRRIFTVELPLSLPIMFAGARIATVTTVGLVTISVAIGQGGLGQVMFDGAQRSFPTPIVVAIVVTIALAITADLLLLGLQRLATPWSRRAA